VIEKHTRIVDEEFVSRLWKFYHDHFEVLNRATPLAQTLDKSMFRRWLKSPRATKLVIEQDDEIVAFAVVSDDLRHDPLVSIEYFKTNYPNRRIFQFPAIAIDSRYGSTNPQTCVELMREMMGCVPNYPSSMAIFFHSEGVNSAMPRLIRFACKPHLSYQKLDAMGCVLLQRADSD